MQRQEKADVDMIMFKTRETKLAVENETEVSLEGLRNGKPYHKLPRDKYLEN